MWGDISLWFWLAFHWWRVMLSIFSSFCWPSVCLLWKNVCPGPLLIFNQIIRSWGVDLCKFFIYLDTNHSLGISFVNIFSHSGSSFCFVDCFIVVRKFLLWCNPNSTILLLSPLPQETYLEKMFLWLMSKRLLLVFSFRHCMVSCLKFRSSIHFEFIFGLWWKKWSVFILLHVSV